MRSVTLRDEREGADRRHLSARLDEAGDLLIEGQDLGPASYELERLLRSDAVPSRLWTWSG